MLRRLALAGAALLALAAPAAAQPATRAVDVDPQGVLRWRDDRSEVALFGANYTVPSASDYRAAGYLGLDRKRLIDQDLAHFARMGWNAIRLSFWGDWENTDSTGALLANDHLDLQDYLIARARERGIYLLLSPIVTYEATWPDALDRTAQQPGFSRTYKKCELGTNPAAVRAQQRYLRELLTHVNPYTRTAYKDEPAIPFVEMVNEPCHHPADTAGSVRYIDALVDAVRSTGSRQILFHNVSQDFRITEAVRRSKVAGATYGWYPTGLNAGRELQGNYLRSVDDYGPMRDPRLAGRPKLVYEFDAPDLRTGTMYPAMARAYRAGGAQLAAMFAYDMLGTASRNLGWQTHYLNLAYTPKKAMGAVIAAEAMRRLPRGQAYGAYPANTRFGPFRVSHEEDLAELAADDAFLYAGTTRTAPPNVGRLTRVAGVGSSPVVGYRGLGAYFLDRVGDGVWRLEVYPDAVPVRDPFEMQSPTKVVTRAVYREHLMRVTLPGLGGAFTVQPVAGPAAGPAPRVRQAADGQFLVTPGVYVLSARGAVGRAALPARVGALAFDEYHAPAPDSGAVHVEWLAPGEYVAGRPAEVRVRVVDATRPDSVTLWARPISGTGWFRRYPMWPDSSGYEYRATVPSDSLPAGLYEFAVTASRGRAGVTYPEGVPRRPWDWDFYGRQFWRAAVVPAGTPVRLFTPADDAGRMAFTRVGDGGRQGLFRLVPSPGSGEMAFRLEPPRPGGRPLEDYTASLVVADRVAARADAPARARRLTLRARGLAPGQRLHVTLVERDGTSWGAAVPLDTAWREHAVALASLRPTRAAMLPQGFPGDWNYWMGPAAGRGGAGDRLRVADVERLQLSLRPDERGRAAPAGVEVERVALVLE